MWVFAWMFFHVTARQSWWYLRFSPTRNHSFLRTELHPSYGRVDVIIVAIFAKCRLRLCILFWNADTKRLGHCWQVEQFNQLTCRDVHQIRLGRKFDHTHMLICAIEVLNIIIVIINLWRYLGGSHLLDVAVVLFLLVFSQILWSKLETLVPWRNDSSTSLHSVWIIRD